MPFPNPNHRSRTREAVSTNTIFKKRGAKTRSVGEENNILRLNLKNVFRNELLYTNNKTIKRIVEKMEDSEYKVFKTLLTLLEYQFTDMKMN